MSENGDFKKEEVRNDKTIPFTVKVSPEIKEEFQRLAETTNSTNKDVFATMVNLLGIKISKEVFSDFTLDIEEFQSTTERLFRSFTNVIERSANMRQNDSANFQDTLLKHEEEMNTLKEVISSSKATINEFKESHKVLESTNQNLQKQLTEKEQSLVNIQSLADVLKEKNTSLEEQLATFKEYQHINVQLEDELDSAISEVEAFKKQLIDAETRSEKQIKQLEMEIIKLNDNALFEQKQKELELKSIAAETKELMQLKIDELNDKHQQQLELSNDKHQQQIDTYLVRIEELRQSNEESLRKQKDDFNNERERLESKIAELELKLNALPRKTTKEK